VTPISLRKNRESWPPQPGFGVEFATTCATWAKEVLGGYALLNAASKEEAVEHTRRFLDHVGQGTCEGTWEGTWETYQLFEMPTGEGQ
jgi:hypothetical protein